MASPQIVASGSNAAPERGGCLRESDIDRLLVQAEQGEQDLLAGHPEDCERCRARLEEALALRETFLAGPYPRTLPQVREEISRSFWSRFALRPLHFGVLSAAAVAAALLLVPNAPTETAPAPEGHRYKSAGSAAVQVLALRGGQTFEPDAQNPARDGDALRFVVTAPEFGHAALLAVENPQAPYPALSAETAASRPLPEGDLPLSGSFVLDDAPGPEQLVVVVSRAPLSHREAMEIAKAHPTGGAAEDGHWEAVRVQVPKAGGQP